MKLRLRTLISGSKTIEHARYNLSVQLTADAMRYLHPVAVAEEKPDRQWVMAEAYLLNGADRERLVELFGEIAEIFPDFTNMLTEIRHIIGITGSAVDAEVPDSLGWNE